MQIKNLAPLALASLASAQTLQQALGAQNASLSTLISLLNSTGLSSQLDSLSNVTLLAPSNDAIAALLNTTGAAATLADPSALSALLQYHILNGTYTADSFANSTQFIHTYLTNASYANVTGGQVVEAVGSNGNVTFYSALKQNISVVTANLNFTGGTIHIVNGLLTIPLNDTETLVNANLTAAVGALQATNLTDAVSTAQDITIFAPSNDAFAAIGSLTSNLSTTDLADILRYHVVPQVVYSTDATNTTVTTLNGTDLTITVINGTVFVNNARVIEADVLVNNGVVHVIDEVLNPSNTTASPDATASPTPAFSGASSGTAGVPFTSGVATPTSTFPAASGTAASTSTSNPAMPINTGAIGAAMLFGGAAALANFQ